MIPTAGMVATLIVKLASFGLVITGINSGVDWFNNFNHSSGSNQGGVRHERSDIEALRERARQRSGN